MANGCCQMETALKNVNRGITAEDSSLVKVPRSCVHQMIYFGSHQKKKNYYKISDCCSMSRAKQQTVSGKGHRLQFELIAILKAAAEVNNFLFN